MKLGGAKEELIKGGYDMDNKPGSGIKATSAVSLAGKKGGKGSAMGRKLTTMNADEIDKSMQEED